MTDPDLLDDEPTPTKMGSAASSSVTDTAYPLAMLWIPDPTTRPGWSEWAIERKVAPKVMGWKGKGKR